MKKIIILFLAGSISICSVTALADENPKTSFPSEISSETDEIFIYLKEYYSSSVLETDVEKRLERDWDNATPYIDENGDCIVPLKGLAEFFYDVTEENGVIYLTNGKREISVPYSGNTIAVDGNEIEFEYEHKNNDVFINYKDIDTLFDMEPVWDGDENILHLNERETTPVSDKEIEKRNAAQEFQENLLSGDLKIRETLANAYTDIDNSKFKPEIAELTALNIISGFEDGTIRPEETLTRAQAAKLFAASLGFGNGREAPTTEKSFSDFNYEHWAYPYVHFLARETYTVDENENKIADPIVINGFTDGTFKPEEPVTVVQFLKMAIAGFGYKGYIKEADSLGGYPIGYAEVSEKHGFSKGLSITDMNAPVTRDMAAKIISNTINIPFVQDRTIRVFNEDGTTDLTTISVTYDGENPNFPKKTIKTMLESGVWTYGETVKISPLESDDAFFVYANVEEINSDMYTLSASQIILEDSSVYNSENSDEIEFTVLSPEFTLEKDTYYYLKIEKQNGNHTVTKMYKL